MTPWLEAFALACVSIAAGFVLYGLVLLVAARAGRAVVVGLGGRVRHASNVVGGLIALAGLWIVSGFLAAALWWLVSLGWGWWPL